MAKKKEEVKAKAEKPKKEEDLEDVLVAKIANAGWMENFRNKWNYTQQQSADQNWQGMNAGLSYTVNHASPSVTYTASSLGSQVKM